MFGLGRKVFVLCFVVSFAGNFILSSKIGVDATSTKLRDRNGNSFDSRNGFSGTSKAKSSNQDLIDDDLDYNEDYVSFEKEKKHTGHIDIVVDTSHNTKSSNGHCPTEFGGLCECGYKNVRSQGSDIKYVVNCTGLGFRDTHILKFLPDDVEHLIFVGNKISTIPVNIFGSKNYTKLKEIDMSRNEITEIKGKAFHHVNSVERLILNFNNISSYSIQNHPRVFSNFYNLRELHLTSAFDHDIWFMNDLAQIFVESNLTKLERLHIEQNHIEHIQNSSIFCELPSLMSLRIAQNKLTDLNISISCLKNLFFIDASYNEIQSVTPSSGLAKLLDEHTTIPKFRIELIGNPFVCDCNIQYYWDWMKKWVILNADRVPHHELIRCETGLPTSNEHMFLKDVTQLECPILKAAEYASSTSEAVSWILGVIAFVVVLTIVYLNRAGIFRRVTPLLHSKSNPQGVKYTSIEKNEEAEIAHV